MSGRSSAKQRAFTKSYLDLLESDAWHFLSINARRLVDFLMIENMRHGGKRNGQLVAPREQLEKFGIGARHISAAIEEVERVGVVDCRRGAGRQPNTYTLTWLPLGDGTAPSDRWRSYRNGFPSEASGVSEGKPQSPVAASEGKPQSPKTRVSEGKHLYRSSYQGGAVVSEVEGKGTGVELGQRVGSGLSDGASSGKPNGRAAP